MPCPVTTDLNRYLHYCDRDEAKQKFIEEQAETLAAAWIEQYNSGYIQEIDRDVTDIVCECQRDHLTEIEVIERYAFDYVQTNLNDFLEWN